MVTNQNLLDGRKDVLTRLTNTRDQQLTISGEVIAHLFASTTGTDGDWIVKLIDVYPDHNADDPKMNGYQLMIVDEIFRGRYLHGFANPQPISPNQINEYVIDLRANNHTFKKGHRLMVQVQSTWFPLYDRNPQTFVENIFRATPQDYRPATQRVYESTRYPTRLTLPVVP